MRKPTGISKEEERIRADEEKVLYYHQTMKKFGGYCVACYPFDSIFGVTVHEVEPRSRHPNDWWLIPDNGCPLCVEHHDHVHTLSTEAGIKFCRDHMARALQGLGKT